MAKSKSVEWQRPLQEALNETDRKKLETRIGVAETALFSRLQQMPCGATHKEELIAIYDAVHSLRLMRCDLYSQSKREEITLIVEAYGIGRAPHSNRLTSPENSVR